MELNFPPLHDAGRLGSMWLANLERSLSLIGRPFVLSLWGEKDIKVLSID